MLPAPKPDGLSLADVLASCLASLSGDDNRLGLRRVDRAIVLLVDGLGADALKASSGHARTLTAAFGPRSVIEAGFPTTTAAALASLTTGELPGQHGLVGYSVLDTANDRLVNQLSGWDDRLDPATWQLVPTLFEKAAAVGFAATVVGPERYRESGFTAAVLRGARYVGAASVSARMHRAAELAAEPGPPGLIYVYVPELDMAAHAHGRASREWTTALENTDAAVRELTSALGPRSGLLVTADHGIVDVPWRSHILVDSAPALLDGVRFVGGEPRCLQLYVEPDLSPRLVSALLDEWRGAESGRAWVMSRDEFVESGWLGPVRPEVLPRLGDIVVAARAMIAYYDDRSGSTPGRSMIGQHGSATPAELRVPLLRFGAFAAN